MSEPRPTVCNSAALRRATRRISQLYDHVMAPMGLRVSQFSILNRIDEMGPSSLNELADALAMDRSTLGHNLRPLERDGLVALKVDPSDRRSRKIELTRAGRSKLATAKAYWAKAQARFEAAFGADRAKELRDVLAVLSSEAFAEAFTDGSRRRP